MAKRVMQVLAAVVFLAVGVQAGWAARIDTSGLGIIGRKIYANECGSRPEKLITWNRGEAFISLGIGHFIWYPEGRSGPYTESFRAFAHYAAHRQVQLPAMLAGDLLPGCPWPDRTSYLAAADSSRVRGLRRFLEDTIPLQARFLLVRLEGALPRMLAVTPRRRQAEIEKRFYQVARTARGRYALTDYVNFKGEGISPTEQVGGVRWGLLQVLETMDSRQTLVDAEAAFAAAAEKVLTRRAQADPRLYIRKKWLPGWKRRVQTYTKSQLAF